MFNFFKSKQPKITKNSKMYLAFYKANKGTLLDKFVGKIIKSHYSHVELVFSNGVCASASPRDKGVRFRKINVWNEDKWDLYEIIKKDVNEEDWKHWFLKHIDQKYDTLGAIGSALNIETYALNKKFCSLCLAILFKLDNINQNPESLRKELIKNNYICYV